MPSGWRGAKRIDANQTPIVQLLTTPHTRGWLSIIDTHDLGHGFGDIIVGVGERNFIFEIKDPGGRQKLTATEEKFHGNWCGQIDVVTSAREIVETIIRRLGRQHECYEDLVTLCRNLPI